MTKKSAKLRGMLDRYQGKDYKLERQKKLQKAAEKRKRSKIEVVQDINGTEDERDLDDGVELDDNMKAALEDALRNAKARGDADGDGVEWGTEEERDEDEGWEDEEETMNIESPRVDGNNTVNEAEDEAQSPQDISTEPVMNGKAHEPKPDNSNLDGNEDDDNDDDEDDDIPLSELSSTSGDDDVVPYQRLTINNTSALLRSLNSIALPLSTLAFSEHQSLTTTDPVSIPDIDDDLNRELALYEQSLSAVKQARTLLVAENVPFTRPSDYFAEMVKSDEHMGKVKTKLTEDAAARQASQDARRQRDLKRFGKQVQQEKLKERAAAKRDMLEKVKVLKRKRQGAGLDTVGEEDLFDVALDDAARTERPSKAAKRSKGLGNARNKEETKGPTRAKRDAKYGFGGKKKFAKSGDAVSSGDMSGFSVKRMKGERAKKGSSQRLGKSRRAKTR